MRRLRGEGAARTQKQRCDCTLWRRGRGAQAGQATDLGMQVEEQPEHAVTARLRAAGKQHLPSASVQTKYPAEHAAQQTNKQDQPRR